MERNNLSINGNTLLGAGAGYAAYTISDRCMRKCFKTVFQHIRPKVNEKDLAIFESAANKAFEGEGFKAKGYKILDASTSEFVEYMNKAKIDMDAYYNKRIMDAKNPIIKLLRKRSFRKALKDFERRKNALIAGTNASYHNLTNPKSIRINMKKGANMFLHELGHAIDYSDPFFAKIMTAGKNNSVRYTPLILALTGALSTSKPEKGYLKNEKTSRFTKFKQFIKSNCGVIATLGTIPILLSEASANIRSQQLSKKYLPKNLMSIATKTNIVSMVGYLTVSLIVWGATTIASNVRDLVVDKKVRKN